MQKEKGSDSGRKCHLRDTKVTWNSYKYDAAISKNGWCDVGDGGYDNLKSVWESTQRKQQIDNQIEHNVQSKKSRFHGEIENKNCQSIEAARD